MLDNELYQHILGLSSPWTLARPATPTATIAMRQMGSQYQPDAPARESTSNYFATEEPLLARRAGTERQSAVFARSRRRGGLGTAWFKRVEKGREGGAGCGRLRYPILCDRTAELNLDTRPLMKARSALDRFENSLGGIVPVALLASLAIAGTVAVFHWVNARPDMQVLSILVAGNVLSKTFGLADVVEKVDDEVPSVAEVRSQKDELDRISASPSVVYAGLFASKVHGAFHLYIDTEHRTQILIKRLKVTEAAKAVAEGMAIPGELLMCMTSFTEDDRVMQTQTRKARLIHPPWVQVESLSSESDGDVLMAELRSKHLRLVGDAKLREITLENILALNRAASERESVWLMDQAPLTPAKWDALIGSVFTAKATEADRAYLLVGFYTLFQ